MQPWRLHSNLRGDVSAETMQIRTCPRCTHLVLALNYFSQHWREIWCSPGNITSAVLPAPPGLPDQNKQHTYSCHTSPCFPFKATSSLTTTRLPPALHGHASTINKCRNRSCTWETHEETGPCCLCGLGYCIYGASRITYTHFSPKNPAHLTSSGCLGLACHPAADYSDLQALFKSYFASR